MAPSWSPERSSCSASSDWRAAASAGRNIGRAPPAGVRPPRRCPQSIALVAARRRWPTAATVSSSRSGSPGTASSASSRCWATIGDTSPAELSPSSRMRATTRWLALRSRRESVPYATLRTPAWTNRYCPSSALKRSESWRSSWNRTSPARAPSRSATSGHSPAIAVAVNESRSRWPGRSPAVGPVAGCRAGQRSVPAARPVRRSRRGRGAPGPASTYCPPRGRTRSRSIRERTVSTANSGIPSARSTRVSRTCSGRPTTSPSSSSPMSRGVSVSRCSTVTRRFVASAGRPSRSAGSSQEQDEERERADREHVLEEAEHPLVGVLRVVDHQDDRLVVADPAQEGGPGREEILALERADGADPQQRTDPGAQPLTLVRVGDEGVETQREQLGLVLVVVHLPLAAGAQDLQPAADGFGEGVERDALAVGQASAAMPAHRGLEAVDVLLELPVQPGLPDPGLAVDDEQRGPAGLLDAVEELLHQPQLAVAADERQPPGRRHAGRLRLRRRRPATDQSGTGSALPFSRWLPTSTYVIADEVSSRVVSSTQTWPGDGGGLHAGGGVDGVAGHHALLLGADRHRDLTGDDADPHARSGNARGPRPMRLDRVDQLEAGANGPLRVVLVGGRNAPHRHHGVADELLHGAAVAAR